jgi:hypothetical protein
MSVYYCHACERQHDGDYIEQADTEPTMCAEYAPEVPVDDMTEQMLQWRDAAKWAENQHQHWKHLAEAATAQRDEARRLHMVVRNELDTLRARLAACERVVEAACEWGKRYGWQQDMAYSFAQKELAAAVDEYRAAVAAETQGEA